jgi:hypothetical protein
MSRSTPRLICTAIAFLFLTARPGSAGPQVVNVWPGVAPGSEKWTQKERTVENTPLGTLVFGGAGAHPAPHPPAPATRAAASRMSPR